MPLELNPINPPFPSPYGVSFILIVNFHFWFTKEKKDYVSVSLRSIIHSYGNALMYDVLDVLKVSVSLRSIIHSYPTVKKVFCCNNFLECYRMIFLFLNFFCLFQLKASLTPLFLNIV